jgi:hypothetical protein
MKAFPGRMREVPRCDSLFDLLSLLKLYMIQHEYAASVWAIIQRYGEVLVPDELNGSDIHRLENVMTMDSNKHDLFDKLQLWLEATVRRQYHHLVLLG